MRIIAAILVLASIAMTGPASAISRYESLGKTCAFVQQVVAQERAVILRFPAPRGAPVLYDRYVADSAQCGISGYAARSYVPTRDKPLCPVYNCAPSSVFNPH